MTDDELILTPSQTLGPMYGFALVFEGADHAVDPTDPSAITVSGVLYDGKGPLTQPDGLVEVWEGTQFARSRSDREGRFQVTVRKPEARVLPDGRPLAPYVNVAVFARGLQKQAQTRMYFPDEDANATDPVLALVDPERRHTLIAQSIEPGLRFDIHLQGEHETVFFAF